MNIRRGEKHQAALIAKTVAATDTLNVKPRAAAQTKPLAVKPVQALTAKRTASSVEAGLNDTVVIIGTDENSGEASPVKMEDLQFAPTDMQPQQFMNPQPDVAVKVESSAAVAPIQGSTTDVSFTNLLPSATVAPSIDLPSLSTASAEVTAQQQPNAPAEEVLSSMSEALAASKLVGEGFHSPNVFPASLVAVKSEDGVTRNSAVANVETLTLYRSTVASVADGNASTESPQSLVKNGEVPVIAALPCIKVEDDSNVIIIWEESV